MDKTDFMMFLADRDSEFELMQYLFREWEVTDKSDIELTTFKKINNIVRIKLIAGDSINNHKILDNLKDTVEFNIYWTELTPDSATLELKMFDRVASLSIHDDDFNATHAFIGKDEATFE